MPDLVIAGAVFHDVPQIDVPQDGGGTASFFDPSDATAVASDIASGKTAYVNGGKITGTGSGGTIVLPSGATYGVAWNYIVPHLDISALTEIDGFFAGCTGATFNPDVSGWDTSEITSMKDVFAGCTGAALNPDVGDWDVSKVKAFDRMFQQCGGAAFNPDISGWRPTEATTFNRMFNTANSPIFNPDLRGWTGLTKLTNCYQMFYSCNGAAFNPKLSTFDISHVAIFYQMFYNCNGAAFNPDFSGWGTDAATTLSGMFYNCSGAAFNPDVTHFDVSKVTTMQAMFQNCHGAAFTPDLSGWDTTDNKLTTCNSMFTSIALNSHKKMWVPSTFKTTSISTASNKPFASNPGSNKVDLYTDAMDATTQGWGTIHSNYTVHYNSTHAQFLAA